MVFIIWEKFYNVFKEVFVYFYTFKQIKGYRQAVLLMLCCQQL